MESEWPLFIRMEFAELSQFDRPDATKERERETLTVCGATSPWYKKGLDELWFTQGSDLMMNRLFVFVKVPKEQCVVFRVFKLNIQHQNILTGILQQYTVGNSKIEKWEKTHLRFLSTPTAVCRSIKKNCSKTGLNPVSVVKIKL